MKTLLALFLLASALCNVIAQSSNPAWRSFGPEGGNVALIAASNDTLYAAVENGRLFRSADGSTWQEITTLGALRTASGLATQNGSIFVVFSVPTDFLGLFAFSSSANAAVSWKSSYSIWPRSNFSSQAITGVTVLGNSYFVAGYQGIAQVTVASVAFQNLERPRLLVSSTTMTCIASRKGVLLGGTIDSVLHRSLDSGKSWKAGNISFPVRTIAFADDTLIFAASTNAIFRSLDAGVTWRQIAFLGGSMIVRSLAYSNGALYAATPVGVMRSRTLGQDWQAVNTGLSTHTISAIVANDSAVFANIPSLSGFHRFENDRFTLFTLPNGRPSTLMSVTETSFWATSSDSVLWRSENGRAWARVGALPINGATLYAITGQNQDREVYISIAKGVFRTRNLGQSWETLAVFNPFDLYGDNTSIASVGDTIWIASCTSIYRSTDRGKSFSRLTLGRYNLDGKRICIYQLATQQGIVYASGEYYGVYDERGDWMLPLSRVNFDSTGIGNFDYVSQARFLSSRRGEGLRGERLTRLVEYLPTNGTWQRFPPIPLTTATMSALGANSKNVFAGTNSGLFVLNAVATSVSGNEERANPFRAAQLHAFPNPAFGDVVLKTSLSRRMTIRLSIFDALGQEVARLADGSEYEAGEQEFVWSPEGVAAKSVSQGVFVARLQAGKTVMTTKILLVK